MTRQIFAYLDPGSSSMIVQMFLGGMAAVGVALKLYWRRFLRLLRIRKDDPAETTPAQVNAQAKAERPAANGAAATPAPASAEAERHPVETKS